MVLERLRLRFGLIAVLFFCTAAWAAGMAIRRDGLPAYEARLESVDRGLARATVTGHGRSFEDYLSFDGLARQAIRPGDTVTVHCDFAEGDAHVCFTGTLASKLSLLAAFGATSLLVAVLLLRPWLRRWFVNGAGRGP
jgi:hypothetical protein